MQVNSRVNLIEYAFERWMQFVCYTIPSGPQVGFHWQVFDSLRDRLRVQPIVFFVTKRPCYCMLPVYGGWRSEEDDSGSDRDRAAKEYILA